MKFNQTVNLLARSCITKNLFMKSSPKSTSSFTNLKDSSNLKTEIKDDTYFIKFNRADKRNCLNFNTIESLKELLEQIDKNEKIKRIVLFGDDKNFCSGFDLTEIKQTNQTKLINLYLSNGDWFKSKKLLIAFVQGYAVGLGFELTVACDIVIADQTAKFGFLNRRFGVPCFLPLTRLRNKIGRLASIELLDDAHLINSKEAYDLGLINHFLNVDSFCSSNQLNELLKSIKIDDKKLTNERIKLNAQFQINKSIDDLPDQWKDLNLSSSLTARHGKFDLSFWNAIQKKIDC